MKKTLHSFSTNYQSMAIFCFTLLLNVGLINGQTEIALNGGFETGDFTDWTQFPSGTQTILSTTPSEGTYYAELNNTTSGAASLIKNANLGVGTAVGGQEVTVTFDARGSLGVGAVAFAELLSEISGGGTSKSQILGGAPLGLDADPNTWKSFSFTTTLGADVSGGVTLQLTATTGAVAGSTCLMNYDNIKITLTDVLPSARVQVIHNSADAIASVVDVYLDGVLTLDDFTFRTASPFIDVPAGTPISVAVAPSNSMSVADAIATFPYNLTDGETYVLVAEGIVSPTGYSPDASTAAGFDIKVFPMGRETAGTSGNTDLLVHHGSTDAPTVDVNEVSGPSVLVDDISYGEFDPNGYLELPTADYTINISTADGLTVVASYDAPLATLGLGNAAAVVVASGFLDPTVNSNGSAFGLWVALPSGGALVELPPAGSTPTEPMVSAAAPTLPESQVLSVFSETYPTNTVANFNFLKFNGTGSYTTVDIESDGNLSGKIEDLSYYGAEWDAVDLTVEESAGVPKYNYVHIDYYATTSTAFNFYLIDATAGIPGGNPAEPRYAFAESGGDEILVQGEWRSVFIPLSHFTSFDSGTFSYDLSDIFQWKFDGNGTLYFDNVYFSKDLVLSNTDFAKTSFKTYPNPTQDSWTIQTQNVRIASITVFDVLGKNVLALAPNSIEAHVDGSSLKSGLYFAQVKTAAGISSIKLVKK